MKLFDRCFLPMRKKKTGILLVIVLSFVILFLTHERILYAVGNFLVIKDRLESADVIHIIAGLDHRMKYGINLYKQGYGKKLFFTGGWCSSLKQNHAKLGRKHALDQGIPPQEIFTDESDVHSTYAEVLRLKEFISKRSDPVHSIIVVSDPHHMRRSRWAYRKVLGEKVKVQMAPVPFELSTYKEKWWADKESRRFVKSEYLKILYYYARYNLSWSPLNDWLASLDRD